MKRIYTPALKDVLTAVGIIAAFYSVLAVIALVAF